jgi:hypothetical protein
MSYETKYLKYKSKYLELKARLAGNQMDKDSLESVKLLSGGGGNKKTMETETETTIRSEGNTLSESMDHLFKQLGGARAKARASRSARSSRKASKKSSKKSRGSRRSALDDSELEEEDYDIMDKMLEDDDEDDFSSSDLDW